MHYSNNPAHVRMSVFKPSGKWVQDIAVDMTGLYQSPTLVQDAVWVAFRNGGYSLELGYVLVCLEPYHEFSHPVMIFGK